MEVRRLNLFFDTHIVTIVFLLLDCDWQPLQV